MLVDAYDLVILDLDGVVVLGDRPVDGAREALARLRATGKPLRFATNNASRRPTEVAEMLEAMGISASAGEVLTSGAAAASLLAQRFAGGTAGPEMPAGVPAEVVVLVVGAPALRAEVAAVGLTPVTSADEKPLAVVQGYGPQVGWADLAEACVAVRNGAWWVATNTDRTLPTPRGPLPGNGALVAALATALGRQPDVVVGKPEPGLFLAAAAQVGARRTLVVGDRLDTDIAGAHRAGMDSLLVLTGVAAEQDVATATPEQRPTYVAANMLGLFAVA